MNRNILAILAVLGLLSCVLAITTNPTLSEVAMNAIMFVAGVLASCVRDVYGFEFGSSAGSKAKSEVISKAIESKEETK